MDLSILADIVMVVGVLYLLFKPLPKKDESPQDERRDWIPWKEYVVINGSVVVYDIVEYLIGFLGVWYVVWVTRRK